MEGRSWEMGGFIVYIVLVVWNLEPSNPGIVAYICKLSTQEAEAGASTFSEQLWMYSKTVSRRKREVIKS